MICFNSSELAKLTGYNKYTKPNDVIELFIKYLYRNRPDLKEKDENNEYIQFITEEEQIDELIKDIKSEDKEIINEVINNNIQNNKELLENSDKLNEVINNTNLSNSQKEVLTNKLNSKINCKYGSNTEDVAIKQYEEKTNETVYENNLKCYIKNFDKFKICGKIDGLIDKNGITYIIEIKNRKNQIFSFIPIYEKIQLLSYTKLLDNNNIIFTQCKDKEQKVEILNNYTDEDLWNEIMFRLNLYTDLINEFQNFEKTRKLFLLKNDKLRYKVLKSHLFWL